MPYFRLPKFHAVSILTNATCTFQIRGMRLIRARQNPRYVTSTAEYRAPMSLTIILKGQSRKVWAVERFRVQHCFSIFPFPKIFCKYCFIISQVGFIEKRHWKARALEERSDPVFDCVTACRQRLNIALHQSWRVVKVWMTVCRKYSFRA